MTAEPSPDLQVLPKSNESFEEWFTRLRELARQRLTGELEGIEEANK